MPALIDVGGQRLEPRLWALLRDAYAAAGEPVDHLVVVQGSYSSGVAASGGTHARNGACDLRTWNLTAATRAQLCRALVVELRKRGLCAWYRDREHGGFDPHIHCIDRYADDLSPQAAWQVEQYDVGRDGLASAGLDYHPRPAQHPWKPPAPPIHDQEDDVLVIRNASSQEASLLSGSLVTRLKDPRSITKLQAAGVKVVDLPAVDYNQLAAEGD
jgi:hypothetical protein